MRKIVPLLIIILLSAFSFTAHADVTRYGQQYCNTTGYHCIKIQRGDSWQNLWRSERKRDVVQRLNRMNIPLRPGMVVAVPDRFNSISVWDISPFPAYIKAPGEKTIIISQRKLAWGAYNSKGELQWWGPVSTGKNYCADVNRRCRTVSGHFRMYHKRGPGCVSSKYPVGKGGAKMPYCMFFRGNYAIHGSPNVHHYRLLYGLL